LRGRNANVVKANTVEARDGHREIRQSTSSTSRRVPGEPGVWVLIFGDLFVFAAFFLSFESARSSAPDTFAAAHALLDRRIGLLASLLLLTSSLFVALSVHRMHSGSPGARDRLGISILLGAGFVVCKVLEYGMKVRQGITPLTNEFFMYYFAFTGIHLVHVLLGLGILMFMRAGSRSPTSPQRRLLIESGGLFWHLVDLLWIVLFALFYVLGGEGG
jgi:nitric oxide reductase NorE protein